MTTPPARRLAFHGMLLFLLSMIAGLFISQLVNPRMALSAHVGGAMSGLFLLALAGIWSHLRLGPRLAGAAVWTALGGFYGSSLGLLLAAALGTGRSSPLNGAGFQSSAAAEAVVNLALSLGGGLVLACCAFVLWGLRGKESPLRTN